MKSYLALSLALGVLGFSGCNSTDNSVADQSSTDAGQLQLVAMKGLAKVASSLRTTDTSATYVFDLDTANSSIQQYFLLQNIGNHDVTHITLTTNNSHFYFVPSEIDLLPPAKTSTLQQLVKLCIVHGTKINGVGPDSLLPMGINIATAQLTGSTTNTHHDSIPISQSADLKVYAKVFDLVAFNGTVPFLFTSGGGFTTSLQEPTPPYTVYTNESVKLYYPVIDTLTVVNRGNVPFHVRLLSVYGNPRTDTSSFEVAAGASFWLSYGWIELNGHGVVSGEPYLQPFSDGKVYFGL